MAKRTQLDQRIVEALQSLAIEDRSTFDIDAYRRAFAESARNKANVVLNLLAQEENPLRNYRPLFVSIGGADGEELRSLLTGSQAELGVLLVESRPLDDADRRAKVHDNKEIKVIEGDAATQITEAMEVAVQGVTKGRGDYVVVTCHAVIHELFDRSASFDPAAFFGTIFKDQETSTWFTYREPGAPEKWPDEVLLSAGCSPESLLSLAEAIQQRHPTFKKFGVAPHVLGDHLRVNRVLAMEVLSKLFYLNDLIYEIQERSTSVEHQQLASFLALAIGARALEERRGVVVTESAPTTSFQELWTKHGITVKGLIEAKTLDLGIPESHTRLIAYRLSEQHRQPAIAATNLSGDFAAEATVAKRGLERKDWDLLSALLGSSGRQWIESESKRDAIDLLAAIKARTPQASFPHLFSHYLLSISELFSGSPPDRGSFSPELEHIAASIGLADLFAAERMEFARKSGDLHAAVGLGNTLLKHLDIASEPESANGRYCRGVVWFLLGNLLRSGGLYQQSLRFINRAETYFDTAIPSHVTERAHCHYARSVCAAMQGFATFQPTLDLLSPRFAAALIRLTASHAAWFTGDNEGALKSAEQAASGFRGIGALSYATRAETVANLIRGWEQIRTTGTLDSAMLQPQLAAGVSFLAFGKGEPEQFVEWFRKLRPSVAVGLLQFRFLRSEPLLEPSEILLPTFLRLEMDSSILLETNVTANSLDQSDRHLRTRMGSPPQFRLPLLPD